MFPFPPGGGRAGWGDISGGFTPTRPYPIQGEESRWLDTPINTLPLYAHTREEAARGRPPSPLGIRWRFSFTGGEESGRDTPADQRTAACGAAAKACRSAAQASAIACLPLSSTAAIPKKP